MTLITAIFSVLLTTSTPIDTSPRGEMLIPSEITIPKAEVRKSFEKQ